jgi:Alpha amylase, C-terminal all-beta domain
VVAQRAFGIEVGDAERLLTENAEEAFDLVEPRGACRRVVKVDLGVAGKPCLDVWSAVGGRVVEDDVQLLVGVRAYDLLHEAEKVGRRVRLGQLVRDLARRDLESRVEVDHSVALVVVRVSNGSPGAKRKRHLRSLQGLNGRFLVDAQHHGVVGWIQIEADDVLHLGGEFRVTADFVGPDEMRPDANAVCRDHPALRTDTLKICHWDPTNAVLAFQRWNDQGDVILTVVNIGESQFNNATYGVGMAGNGGTWEELFNSQSPQYGGWVRPSGLAEDQHCQLGQADVEIAVPLGAAYFSRLTVIPARAPASIRESRHRHQVEVPTCCLELRGHRGR